jgi:hypothetical protein
VFIVIFVSIESLYFIMSYWTKRRKINSSVAKEIADLCQARENSAAEIAKFDNFSDVQLLPVHNFPVDSSEASESDVCTFDLTGQTFSDDWLDNEDECVSSADECDGASMCSTGNIADKLRTWAVNESVTQSALSSLLKVLRKRIPELPADARTLLKSDSSAGTETCITNVSGGQYYHFGISDNISHELRFHNVDHTDTVLLQINIDGLPLFKSSNGQFWPILGKVCKPFVGTPFVIGIFYGSSKPADLQFSQSFVDDFVSVKDNGILYRGATVDCCIHAMICDSPARAFVKNVKGHTAYSSCERCVQSGVWNRKMTFPETNAVKRTDVMFDEMADDDHHKGPTVPHICRHCTLAWCLPLFLTICICCA